MNRVNINLDKYGEEKIERFSKIYNRQYNEYVPNFTKLNTLVTNFNDESDFFQYG